VFVKKADFRIERYCLGYRLRDDAAIDSVQRRHR